MTKDCSRKSQEFSLLVPQNDQKLTFGHTFGSKLVSPVSWRAQNSRPNLSQTMVSAFRYFDLPSLWRQVLRMSGQSDAMNFR